MNKHRERDREGAAARHLPAKAGGTGFALLHSFHSCLLTRDVFISKID